MQLTLTRPRLISLAAGFTDNESLPTGEVRRAVNAVLGRNSGRDALQYGSTQGDPTLRRLTSAHLHGLDSGTERAGATSAYAPDRMIITNGSQQLLYLVTEALCDPGDLVLVEDPTYFVYLGILQSRGLQARSVPIRRDGMDLDRLEQLLDRLRRSGELKRVKLLYLVSYFQNPTGVTTSFAKKKAIVSLLKRFERAAGHPIYLLEDAAYRELRFAGSDVASGLAVPGGHERVIYAGTYSKPFTTGARVGFGILPEPLFTAVLRIKGNHDFGTSNLLQQLMARVLASGRYARHVRALQQRYARKAAVMRAALRRHFPPEIELWEPEGGLYFWARLPRTMKCGPGSKLFRDALSRDVLYVPGELCYGDDRARRKPGHEMRISFGGAAEKDIPEGIKRLAAACRKFL
jgi:2-aminoadipate transaminase